MQLDKRLQQAHLREQVVARETFPEVYSARDEARAAARNARFDRAL